MTLYDVEVWARRDPREPGVYLYTMSGPFTDRDAAEREATELRENQLWQPGLSVVVLPFQAPDEAAPASR